jgi:hypothetical protein
VKRYLLLVPCLLIVSAVALSACGGDSDDEGKIEDAIQTSATSSDPSNCTKLQTRKFDEQNSETEGAAAVAECEKESEDEEDQAESVEVSNVSVNGEDASAEVALSGGGLDGQTLEIDLIKDGSDWRLDEIVSFTDYDPKKLGEAFEERFEDEEVEIPAKIASCLAEAFGSASQSEAEELLFSGSQDAIEELVVNCQ